MTWFWFDPTSVEISTLIENDINGNPIYIWDCAIWLSLLPDNNIFRIKKIEYDIDWNTISIKFANWDSSFNKKWNDRATYLYS